jgi:hypothetical protein
VSPIAARAITAAQTMASRIAVRGTPAMQTTKKKALR